MRMKDALCRQLKNMRKDKVKTAMFTVYGLNDGGKLYVSDRELLPDIFFTQKIQKVIDEKAVKEALRNGAKVPGARLYDTLTVR